jgi:hypothetical protein
MAVLPGAPPGLPPGVPPPPGPDMAAAPPGPGDIGAAGPPQFPSADPQAIMALLSQLIAVDQQKLGEAQVQAVGGAFSQLLQSQPDPAAAAAVSGPPGVVGPEPGGPGGAGY